MKNHNIILLILCIVIIAIAIVVVIVYTSLYVKPNYGWGGLLPNPCTAVSNYTCQNVIYSHQTDNITLALEQNTGTNWISVDFVFVKQGTQINSTGIPLIAFTSYPANITYSSIGLDSGKQVYVNLAVNGTTPPVLVGSSLSGEIWARYILVGDTSAIYIPIAAINIKAS